MQTSPHPGKTFFHTGLFLLGWMLWLVALNFLPLLLPPGWMKGTLNQYGLTAVVELLLGLPVVLFCWLKKIKPSALLGRVDAGQIGAGLLLGVLLLPLTLTISLFSYAFVMATGGLPLPQEIPIPANGLELLAACAVTGLLAPIVEEPVMRGIVLRGAGALRRTAAVLITALAFALPHGQFTTMPTLLFLSLVLTALVWRTGSLWPAMALHMTYNAASMVLTYISDQVQKQSPLPGEGLLGSTAEMLVAAFSYALISLPFAALSGLLLFAVWRYTPKADRPTSLGRLSAGQSWPWVAAGVLMAGYLLLNALQVYGVIGSQSIA